MAENSNPWGRAKTKVPRYEAPKKEKSPLDKDFSVRPQAIAAVERLKSKINKQKSAAGDKNITGISRADILKEIAPYIMNPRAGESRGEYQQRANGDGMLSWSDADALIEHELGNIGTIEGREESTAHQKRLDELASERGDVGEEAVMIPYLVNVSWTYRPVSGRSPPVVYSIEGVFYGFDAELTMEAGRDFMLDNIVPAASYKTRGIMDLTVPDVSMEPATKMQAGAMSAGYTGDDFRMRVSDDMSDERFKTEFMAMFTRPETGKQTEDKDFGYYATPVSYKWLGRRLVSV